MTTSANFNEALANLSLNDRYEDCDAREAAAKTLGNIGDSRAVDPLIIVLADEAPAVRLAAAKALGCIGDPRAAQGLAARLYDRDRIGVACAAAQSLVKIGAGSVEALVAILSDENSKVRELAVKWGTVNQGRELAASALGEIGIPRAVESLIEAFNDKHGQLASLAANALANICDARAVPILLAAVKRKDRKAEWVIKPLEMMLERFSEFFSGDQLEQLCHLENLSTTYTIKRSAEEVMGYGLAPEVTKTDTVVFSNLARLARQALTNRARL